MPGSALLPLRVAILAGLVLTAGAGALPAQERVGINSAVNPQATGTPPGGAARRLMIGQDIPISTIAAAPMNRMIPRKKPNGRSFRCS